MKFTIPCETFVRLSKIALSVELTRETGMKNSVYYKNGVLIDPDYFRSIHIEAKSGKAFAVSTNIAFAAIEYLGATDQPDGFINVACDADLIAQCEKDAKFNGVLTVSYVEMLKFASVSINTGYNFSKNGAVFCKVTEPPIVRWRNWLPEKIPTEKNECMFVDADLLAILASSSPSGSILFPEFTSEVVVVRDAYSENWLGAFLGAGFLKNGTIAKNLPVKMPSWVK